MSDIRKAIMARLGEFARPGAKAAMAKWETERSKRWDKPITEHSANIRGNSFRIEVPEGSSSGTLFLWNDMRGFERIQSGSVDSLKRMAEQMGAKEARGVAAIERRANYSRPGAKAAMAKYRIGAQVAVDYKGETVRGTISSLVTESPETYMVDIRGKNVRVKRLLSEIKQHFPTQNWLGETMSRPGAKAEMGRAEQVMRDGSVYLDFRAAKEWLASVTEDALRYIISDSQKAAKAMPDGNKWNYYHDLSLTAQDELQRRQSQKKATAAKPKSQDAESEEVKAGLKLMEKADEKVSEKIRTLIKEGKPQDQAVAIALDMKRRGEL